MRVLLLSIIVLVSLSIVFSGCRMRQQSPRIPVSCSGPPSKDDYLITARGDLLINGDKCKFRFPQNRKGMNKKPQSKDRSWNQSTLKACSSVFLELLNSSFVGDCFLTNLQSGVTKNIEWRIGKEWTEDAKIKIISSAKNLTF